MSAHKAARFAVRLVVLGAVAATLGGFSGYAMRSSRAVPAEPSAPGLAEPQIPNRAAKADRLAIVAAAAAAPAGSATYSLASLAPAAEVDRTPETVNETPALRTELPPADASKPVAAPVKHAARPAAPMPHDKPKRLPPPPPAPSVLLDDTQIAGVKARLRLTSDQQEYWPAVETALRDVVRTHLRTDQLRHAHGGKAGIDVNSPEVQRLVWAAMPLLMRLREDQKREVRKLARVIGLESVAAQI